jgi:recombination protein RecR
MTDRVEDLARAFERFPGIGPRQAKRFVYHLLSVTEGDRLRLSDLIAHLGADVQQCTECMRYWSGVGLLCNYCTDISRNDDILMIVEKDQDLLAVERANAFRGRYFVLGGVLTLSGKGHIREQELVERVERRIRNDSTNAAGTPYKATLTEIVLALSATNEGGHTADRIRELLTPLREHVKLSVLGRGLSTGSELEYADAETLSGALQNRKET